MLVYSKTMTVTVTKLSVNGRSVGNAVSRTVGRTVLDIGAGRLALKQRICRYEPGRRITDSRSEQNQRQTWQDTRSTTKTKAAAIKRHIGGTGGGPTCDIQLNDVQKDALSLISPSLVSGHENTAESNVEFIFEDPENDILDNDQLCVEEYIDVYNESNDYETYNHPSIIVPTNSIKIKSAIAPIPDITRVNENPNKEQASIFASKPKPDLKRKKTTATCLGESNTAATRLGDIAQRKCDLKEAYYEKKIKLLEENNVLLKNIGTTLGTLLTKLTEK
ncbi:uncharacterized protein LOC126549056 [Aphis gossypii]|uniref:uncharacterized protein LOC126549056 n=1 Tax=Aphis gossypii TaxID=80765 RepID=UPI00215986E3|nr:uncharacterized protein LOC126549056 [Aphis gossypii]